MKIINAYWEKRNLDVTCAEFEIGKNDSVTEVINAVRDHQEQYLVAKVTTNKVDVLLALQQEGFFYIESLFEIVNKTFTSFFINISEQDSTIGYHVASMEEMLQVVDLVRDGNIFSTDRISLDPFFSQKLAGHRYSCWMSDLIHSEKTKMVIAECNDENIGFLLYLHNGNNCYVSPLGGLFTQYLDSGLGVICMSCGMRYLRDIGAKKMTTHVSSNNLQMLRLHMLYGAQITKMQYVLIRHQA